MVRRSRSAALALVLGAMTLPSGWPEGVLSAGWLPNPLAPRVVHAAPADVGPPPTLPDIGPPPTLPDFSSPNAPPGPTTPSGPPGATPPAAPQNPPAGPPIMRPSVRPPAVTPPTATPPAASPPAASPPAAPPSSAPSSGTPPPVAVPPPSEPSSAAQAPSAAQLPPAEGAAAPAVPSASSVGDPSLQAPVMEGADPVAPEEAPKAPKTREEEEEEAARALRKTPKKWRHNGLILEPRLGVYGCTRQFCASSQGHQERPGVTLGGFVGGNVFGLVDIGLEAAWATLRPGDLKDKNAVTLYGLDPPRVEQALSRRLGQEVDVDFDQLIVSSAKARTVSAGPALRIHFLRRGRGVAYFGTGIHYQLWRNRYETSGGPTRIDFHGFVAPFRFGGGAFVHPNIAVLGEFAYHYAFYVVTGVSHPELSGFAPVSVIEGAALDAGADLRKGLPHFWSFSVSVRFRLGL